MAACGADTARTLACRNGHAAVQLKLISIAVIFITSVVDITSPVLLARHFQGKPALDRATLLIKCFAVGVILSISLVHVLPDAFAALSDCHVLEREVSGTRGGDPEEEGMGFRCRDTGRGSRSSGR